MKKILLSLLAVAALSFAMVGGSAPALAGSTALWSPTKGDVTLPIVAPTKSAPGTLDNTTIGATTPEPGNFTTLTSTSAPSGAGITALFASPPALGGTAPAAVTGTSVSGATFKGTGSAPAPTGTGTPTIATGSTNFAGEVTAGASATSVVITFAGAPLANAPFCVVSTQTGGIISFAYAITTSAITVTQSATSGDKIDYVCPTH